MIGGFNTVILAFEKRGGNQIPFRKLEVIGNFILKTGLVRPKIHGNKFTWKLCGCKNIHCMPDRILLNHNFF